MFFSKKLLFLLFTGVGIFLFFSFVLSASPTGNNWFQLLASPYTGTDNTGDGGSGNPNDYNYYYVGQTFTQTIQITSENTNAANIWIDHDATITTSSNLSIGSYFPSWSGQNTVHISGDIWRIRSTGYRTDGNSSGLGTFGSAQFSALKPTAAAYGTGAPTTLDINIGAVGSTTESNISYNGNDLLDDAEDFKFHVWADTKKPYALNPSPSDGSSGITIDGNYTFDLRDSKNGEGDNSGVGTGVNISTPPGTITFDDGTGAVSYSGSASYSCSGTWGTNLCAVTINPISPSGIAGDTRNWEYNTTYTILINGYRDYASASQDQLGDSNGPNTLDSKTWTFITENDTTPPQVVAETPVRASSGNSVSTSLVIDIQDKKTFPSDISGSGVDAGTCKINISSTGFPLITFEQGDSGVTVTAIDYGYRFTINPASDFAQNETVSVAVYDCEDLAGNIMTTDNYTFSTADIDAPYVDNLLPLNDATVALNDKISFHLKDVGVGIDLDNTIVYLNGNYYTNDGGAGSVTTNGTRITFSTSSNFNGGNYAGDTTVRTGSTNDYTFTLDPEENFISGEAIPVIIFSRDLSGNLMEYNVYAVSTGGTCPSGSTYCGSNTSWSNSLLQCIGTGGGGCSSGGSGNGIPTTLNINPGTCFASQIDDTSVLITWFSNLPGTTRVVYGPTSVSSLNNAFENLGYSFSTIEKNDNLTYHSVVIKNLEKGKLYYFRPITKASGITAFGPELLMVSRCEILKKIEKVCVSPAKPVTPTKKPGSFPDTKKPSWLLKILNIQNDKDNKIYINGKAAPNIKIKAFLY